MKGKTSKLRKTKNVLRAVFSSPGTPKYVGEAKQEDSKAILMIYNKDALEISELQDISTYELNDKYKTWLNIDGIHDSEKVVEIGKKFGLHPLIIEDILNTIQKPKEDIFSAEHQLFVSMKVPKKNAIFENFETEHISLILTPNTILSFQEKGDNDIFESIYTRVRRENSKTKMSRIDYLFYVLVDYVVDNYFVILDNIEEKIENLSEQILINAKATHQNDLFFLKKDIASFKRIIFPLKDILIELLREDNAFFSPETKVYLRDVYDHVKEILDNIEIYKEEIESLTSNYHSQMSNKMNSVMKTLTVFTAIFMPLTFIAGLYGMNFKYMPELEHPNGYFYTLAGMFLLAVVLWIYFKFKKYI